MKRSRALCADADVVLLMVAQQLPVLPATIPCAVQLRALNKKLRAGAPHWPSLAKARNGNGYEFGQGTLGIVQLLFWNFAPHQNMWTTTRKFRETFAIAKSAAFSGRIDVVEICLRHCSNVQIWQNVMDGAAAAGRLDVLQWLQSKGPPLVQSAIHEAIRHGWLHILQWAASTADFRLDYEMQKLAASYGHIHILEWMLDQKQPKYPITLISAILNGKRDVIEWLVQHGYEKTTVHTSTPALYGDISMLKFLRDLQFPWDESVCSEAASGGHLPLLQWARGRGCPWNKNTCVHAARNGYVDVLAWAKENGCPWTDEVYRVMICSGEVDVPLWAIEQGWRVTQESILLAREMEAFDVADILERAWNRQQLKTTPKQ